MKRIIILILIVFHSGLYAAERPSKTGWLRIQLAELPQAEVEPIVMKQAFNPKAEVFEIFIPPDYDPAKTYGVLAWVSPYTTAEIPRQFEQLFTEYGFIAVGADRIGNDQPWQRRIPILESAVMQLSKTLNVDPEKRIISGLSGGGRTAAMACFLHPQFWKGSISWVGGNFYKAYEMPMPIGSTKRGINDYDPGTISDEQVKKARENCNFVLVTGPKDFNLNDSRGIYRSLRRENFKALLLEEPGLGHEVGSAEYMRKSLDFVLRKNQDSATLR